MKLGELWYFSFLAFCSTNLEKYIIDPTLKIISIVFNKGYFVYYFYFSELKSSNDRYSIETRMDSQKNRLKTFLEIKQVGGNSK